PISFKIIQRNRNKITQYKENQMFDFSFGKQIHSYKKQSCSKNIYITPPNSKFLEIKIHQGNKYSRKYKYPTRNFAIFTVEFGYGQDRFVIRVFAPQVPTVKAHHKIIHIDNHIPKKLPFVKQPNKN